MERQRLPTEARVCICLRVFSLDWPNRTDTALGENPGEGVPAIGNTVTLFMGLSVVITAVLLCVARPVVLLIGTPAEAVEGTVSYLIICFIGIPFIVAYNIISSIFRGMGDSKSPMFFIGVACVVNVILDYVFMGRMQMGPAGAALGTTLAQTVSVVVALFYMKGRKTGISLKRQDFVPRRKVMGELLKVGVPVAVQDVFRWLLL